MEENAQGSGQLGEEGTPNRWRGEAARASQA